MRLCRFYKIPRFFDFSEFQGQGTQFSVELKVEAGEKNQTIPLDKLIPAIWLL